MIEQYQSEPVRSAHLNGQAVADLRSALGGRLTGPLDVQVLTPHPVGDPHKGTL
jgi:hypothetical protein